MKVLNLKSAVLLACLSLASVGANAATALSSGYNPILQTSPAGSFSYDYTFTVGANEIGTIAGSIFSTFGFTSAGGFGSALNTPTLTQPSWSFSSLSSTGVYSPVVISPVVSVFNTGYTFSANNLVKGTYTLTFSGVAYSASAILGGVSVSSSPVPEADAYSMMLLGLGLIGFVANRRRV